MAMSAASGLPEADPEQAGFCPKRLQVISKRYQRGVDSGEIPGAVVIILRDGHLVYNKAIGFADRVSGLAMTTETQFWLASMTKPVTSVVAMMLVEQGLIDLAAPVSQYLPEFADLTLGMSDGSGGLERRPIARHPTVHDLMRHTAGLVYGEFGSTLVHKAYLCAELFTKSASLADMVSRIAKLPLVHEPGEVFEYSVATDVLGRIVECVAGEDFATHVARTIAAPLGITSFGFYVPEGEPIAWADGIPPGPAREALARVSRTMPPVQSPGGGLYGTAADYARFAQMLLDGGTFAGSRLLSPRSVAYMTANHLHDGVALAREHAAILSVIAPSPSIGQGFGLGFAVRTDPGLHPALGSIGDFYWAGAGGTYFWVDPAEGLVVVALTAQPDFNEKMHYRQLARSLVYQALTNSRQHLGLAGSRIISAAHLKAAPYGTDVRTAASFLP